jgi:N-carbamoylputrescine amidase
MDVRQGTMRTLHVAAVQIESRHGQIEDNWARSVPLIEEAARNGAELVVLPELFACGYVPNQTVWDYAEPKNGPTVTWLSETAGRLGIYLGAGLVEVEGRDFFNDFVIAAPDGRIAGRARKDNGEAYCFRRGRGHHIIETRIGRIGVGICGDNHYTAFVHLMQTRAIDLMLMPHAWPTLYKASKLAKEEDLLQMEEDVIRLAPLYAGLLGVPVVFVNAVGVMGQMSGLFGKIMDPTLFRLQGLSRIVDSDGTLKGALGKKEGVLVTEVTLDPSQRRYEQPKDYDGNLNPGSALLRKVILPVDIALGTMAYRLNPQRYVKARRILTTAGYGQKEAGAL